MSALTDQELMRKGDEESFACLRDRHGSSLYRHLRSWQQGPEKPGEIEEVYWTVWAKLHRTRSKFDPRYPFDRWLYAVARVTVAEQGFGGYRVPGFEDAVRSAPSVSASVFEDLPPAQRRDVESRVQDEMAAEAIIDEIVRRIEGGPVRRFLRTLGVGN